jgi:hypothetical protein
MNRRKEISDELTHAAPTLAGIDNQHPYRVPAGYFETLPQIILLRIKSENTASPAEELQAISPLLSSIGKKMPYNTPDGYFESLIPGIEVARPVTKEPARVVRMFQPKRTFRMAAAAAMVGVIGIAAWFFMKDPSTSYAVTSDIEVQKELKTKVGELSENELANFVEGNNILSGLYSNTVQDMNEEDVKLMLADIPDQELEKYLDQHATKEKFN